MSRFRILFTFVTVLLLAATGTIAFALPETYVSSTGSDSNSGALNSPCLTLNGAYTKTDTGGEIDVLNPGEYSLAGYALVINKSITIDGGAGRMGTVLDPIYVEGGTVTIRNMTITESPVVMLGTANVTLDNLVISSTSDGIYIEGANDVVADNCTINVPSVGVYINSFNPAGAVNMTLLNSRINGGLNGVWALPGTNPVYVSLHGDSIQNDTSAGVQIEDGAADVSDCTVSGCTDGLVADNGGALVAEDNMISHGTTGILVNTGSSINLSNNVIAYNQTGVGVMGSPLGVVTSASNNKFVGNKSNGYAPSPTITVE